MGSGSSSRVKGDREQIIRLMMPTYYVQCDVTTDDIKSATTSWALISEDTGIQFKELLNDPTFTHSSCIGFFYVVFYERLFDVHPCARPLFKNGVISQGKFLVKMISATLNQLGNPSEFESTMKALAIRHCERGIRAIEYGLVGEVLFYSLRRVLGKEYTPEVELAWQKVYSAMLAVIVPLVIEIDLNFATSNGKQTDNIHKEEDEK
jgi:hemoglobin-like flavoprotein